ncbi:MAG: hypothetical protein AB8B69_26455 [Chitinophagales bacterium]
MEIVFFLLAFLLFFFAPILIILEGVAQLKKNPETAKQLIIIAEIWLLVGFGLCGSRADVILDSTYKC